MDGHIQEVGASFAVWVDGKIAAIRPDIGPRADRSSHPPGFGGRVPSADLPRPTPGRWRRPATPHEGAV